MSLEDLYRAHETIERVPVEAQKAERQAAQQRKTALDRLGQQMQEAKTSASAKISRMETELRQELQACRAIGVLPQQVGSSPGRSTALLPVRDLRGELSKLPERLAAEHRLLGEARAALVAVRETLEEEQRRRKRYRIAIVVGIFSYAYTLALLAAVAAIGPNVVAVLVLALALALLATFEIFVDSWPLFQYAKRRPEVLSNRSLRVRFVLRRTAGIGILALLAGLAVFPLYFFVEFPAPLADIFIPVIDLLWVFALVFLIFLRILFGSQLRARR